MEVNSRLSLGRSGRVFTWGLFVAGVLLGRAVVPVHAQEPDLDALIGWPFPTELTAASSAAAVTWVRNERGARNVWLATGPDWSGRRLTTFTRDDGQEVSGLSISADGTTVAFVRGGAPNRAGEIPNPESDPAGVGREIWTAAADGSGARRLGPGHSPLLTRDGAWVIYLNGGEILRRPAGDPEAAAQSLVKGRGSPGELRLSPDGTSLAWTSRRGDHAFIGVMELSAGEVRYMDPSVDQDGSPVWSPDGSELAFLRIPNRRGRLPFFAVRESLPWSIRIVHPEDGAARTVFTAEPGPGSLFQGISASSSIFWGADDRIAFPWERNGYTNLYSVRADGSESPRAVSAGHFEVQYVTLAPDGEALVFSSNEDDTLGSSGRRNSTVLKGFHVPPILLDTRLARATRKKEVGS